MLGIPKVMLWNGGHLGGACPVPLYLPRYRGGTRQEDLGCLFCDRLSEALFGEQGPRSKQVAHSGWLLLQAFLDLSQDFALGCLQGLFVTP